MAACTLMLVSCGGGEAKKKENGGNASLIKELNVNSPDTDQYLLVPGGPHGSAVAVRQYIA